MLCKICGKTGTDKHHVIYRSQSGSNNPENLIPLCRSCHDFIHHSPNCKRKKEMKKVCYDYVRLNIDKCWKGKIKPKIVRMIENGDL